MQERSCPQTQPGYQLTLFCKCRLISKFPLQLFLHLYSSDKFGTFYSPKSHSKVVFSVGSWQRARNKQRCATPGVRCRCTPQGLEQPPSGSLPRSYIISDSVIEVLIWGREKQENRAAGVFTWQESGETWCSSNSVAFVIQLKEFPYSFEFSDLSISLRISRAFWYSNRGLLVGSGGSKTGRAWGFLCFWDLGTHGVEVIMVCREGCSEMFFLWYHGGCDLGNFVLSNF